MVTSGGVLATLSTTALKDYDFSDANSVDIYDCNGVSPSSIYFSANGCSEFYKSNTRLLWLGIGIAGAGAIMVMLGKARQQSVLTLVPMPGGVAVLRQVTF